jgi:hypothetical protein
MVVDTTKIYGSTVTYVIGLLRDNLVDVDTPTATGTFKNARSQTSDWVVSSFPKPKKYGYFPGYPIVIVNSPDVEESNISLKQTKINTARLSINILDKNDSLVNIDNVSGQIKKVFLDNRETLNVNGIPRINLVGSTFNQPVGGDDTLIRTLDYDITYRKLEGYS